MDALVITFLSSYIHYRLIITFFLLVRIFPQNFSFYLNYYIYLFSLFWRNIFCCGFTLRVTSKTLFSPEYITSKHTQKISFSRKWKIFWDQRSDTFSTPEADKHSNDPASLTDKLPATKNDNNRINILPFHQLPQCSKQVTSSRRSQCVHPVSYFIYSENKDWGETNYQHYIFS